MDITEHINRSRLSRSVICETAGISRAYLSLIEKNIRRIGVTKVKGLADALGVSVGDLRPDLAGLFFEGAPQPGEPHK